MSKNYQKIVIIKDQAKGQVEEVKAKAKEAVAVVLNGRGYESLKMPVRFKRVLAMSKIKLREAKKRALMSCIVVALNYV